VRRQLVQDRPIVETAIAYWDIGTYFGTARSQNDKGHVLGHVRDLGLSSKDPNVRVYQTTERQNFHTDSSDIVSLPCLKTAKSGGLPSLTSSMTVCNEMARRRSDLVQRLFLDMRLTAAVRCRKVSSVVRKADLQRLCLLPVGNLRAALCALIKAYRVSAAP
jgi:Taurine catabolism dioxygenase TauD, TfdA family